MKKYEYLLFDADNTLFDFSLAEKNAFYLTCNEQGIDHSEALYETYSEINDALWKKLEKKETTLELLKKERFRQLLFTVDPKSVSEDTVSQMSTNYMENLGKQTCLIEDAVEICRILSQKYRLFLITNGISRIQKARFASSELNGFFEEVFISEDMGYSKPAPGYFDYVIAKIGDKDLSKYLVIGDSLTSDCDGAIGYGLDICRFNPKSESDNGRKLTYSVKKLMDLCDIL